jgi:hypothetical protein
VTENEALIYVRASAAVLRLPLDDEQVVRVAAHLQRSATLAQLLEAVDMPPELELAEIYRPNTLQPASNRRELL